MNIDGQQLRVMIDTGCGVTLVSDRAAQVRKRMQCCLTLETMNGQAMMVNECVRLGSVKIDKSDLGPIIAYVFHTLPLGADVVLGMDVIGRVGMSIASGPRVVVSFGESNGACVATSERVNSVIEDSDFTACFEDGKWCVRWKWREHANEAKILHTNIIAEADVSEVEKELDEWLSSGILVEYDPSQHGEIKQVLPIIAVRQTKGSLTKVRPVLDYRSMNQMIESHPGGATPICGERLREWRQLGPNAAVIDLRQAYLQVRVSPDLWTWQAISWKGHTYLLTRLGFGLSSAPKIMTAIVEFVIGKDSNIDGSVSSYIDDLFIVLDRTDCQSVIDHLRSWGLESKEPEKLGSSGAVRILGLQVDQDYKWRRDGELPLVPSDDHLTRRKVSGILGKWLGHYPVAGWLRVVCGSLQRSMAESKAGWDEPVDAVVLDVLRKIDARLRVVDPVRGEWLVDPDAELVVWTDASQTAMGVVIECSGNVIEDDAWLRSAKDLSDINKSELEAVIKGLTLALRWKRRHMTIVTDSATVAGWLRAVIEKRQNVKTKALEEILIRRRLNTLSEIIAVENLCLTVRLVKSAENLADKLTRIPADCQMKIASSRDASVLGLAATFADVKTIHDVCHFGVDRTLELAKERHGNVSKRLVRRVVSRCHVCARIDPACFYRYEHGHIQDSRCWDRLAVDITHFDHVPYLSVIDVASKFTIWRALRNESADEVVKNLRSIFSEFGPPRTILSDNGTSFRAAPMHDFLRQWEVSHELSGAYRPQGNSVVERVHRTVKRVARRGGKSVDEAVFWVNNTRGNKSHAPYEVVFCATSRKPGISEDRTDINRPVMLGESNAEDYFDTDRNPFAVGDLVYLRPPSGRCDELWTGPHRVTSVRSRISVELDADGVARHISHIRPVPGMCEEREDGFPVRVVEDSDPDDVDCRPPEHHDVGTEEEEDLRSSASTLPSNKPPLDAPLETRRSCREKRPPRWHEDYCFD